MARVLSIEEYAKRQPIWTESLQTLYQLCLAAGMDATIKWGAPVFVYRGKNCVGVVGFKNHFALWFYNGAFLSDPEKKLINANEGKTKGLMQLRFNAFEEINPSLIRTYLDEAIANEQLEKRITIERNKGFELPHQLKTRFDKNKILATAFKNLTVAKQREYAEYIMAAKREATCLNRVEKCIPLILEGTGLYDKYKK